MPFGGFLRGLRPRSLWGCGGEDAGAILASLDELGLPPNPSDWVNGPGNLGWNSGFRTQAREKGAVVERFSALRARVVTAGDRRRFDYWRDTLRASVILYALGGIRGDSGRRDHEVNAEADAARKAPLAADALALRLEFVLDGKTSWACKSPSPTRPASWAPSPISNSTAAWQPPT